MAFRIVLLKSQLPVVINHPAFLVELRHAARDLPGHLTTTPFSILGCIGALAGQIKAREPGVFEKGVPVLTFLQERLAPVHGRPPVAFCHGGCHPLNTICSKDDLQPGIAWEFCGARPERHEDALLIGCIGMEDPDALAGDLVNELIRGLRAAVMRAEQGWRVLVEMLIAIRFAWRSEWLRTRDAKMIELGTVSMHLLVNHAMTSWRCGEGEDASKPGERAVLCKRCVPFGFP